MLWPIMLVLDLDDIGKIENKRMIYKILALFLFLFTDILLYAQPDSIVKHKRGIELNYLNGHIFDHRHTLSNSLTNNVNAFEIKYSLFRNKNTQWQKFYNQTNFGYGLYYANLMNNNVLGKIVAPYFFSEFTLFSTNKMQSFINVGFGLSYLNRPFNPDNNYYNISIGSNVNSYLDFSTGLVFNFLPQLNITTGLVFHHFSNGNVKEPNLGINVVSAQIGLMYSNVTLEKNTDRILEEKQSHGFYSEIISAYGIKSLEPANEVLYFTSSQIIDFAYLFNAGMSSGLGLDIFYDTSLRRKYANQQYTANKPSEYMYYGLHGSFNFHFGRFAVPLHFGYILFPDYKPMFRRFMRLGIRYFVTDKLCFNVSIKAQRMTADYLEWGLGWRLFSTNY